MKQFIYQPIAASGVDFIRFWAACYSGDDEDFYVANCGRELTEARILDWFRWKNGTPLSAAKKKSVMKNFVARRHELSHLQEHSVEHLLTHFEEGGVIWRIFWLHCFQPARFPIYDQHVHRAMTFILDGAAQEMPTRDEEKIRAYVKEYIPFHASFALPHRTVDKALWTFGKFIGQQSIFVEQTMKEIINLAGERNQGQ